MKLTKIALPQEHGSWSFLYEPLLLALLVAYSTEGLYVAISSFFIFLAHQPIRIFFDGKSSKENKNKALFFMIVYLGAAAFFLWQTLLVVPPQKMVPFFVALSLMGGFLLIELQTQKENFVARLVPPLAIDLIAISIVDIGGWEIIYCVAFYLVLLARSVTTSFYVHEKLKKMRKTPYNPGYVYVLHVVTMIILMFTAWARLTPYLTLLAVVVLFVRAALGLKATEKTNAKKVGIWEVIHGLVFIAINALGYSMLF